MDGHATCSGAYGLCSSVTQIHVDVMLRACADLTRKAGITWSHGLALAVTSHTTRAACCSGLPLTTRPKSRDSCCIDTHGESSIS